MLYLDNLTEFSHQSYKSHAVSLTLQVKNWRFRGPGTPPGAAQLQKPSTEPEPHLPRWPHSWAHRRKRDFSRTMAQDLSISTIQESGTMFPDNYLPFAGKTEKERTGPSVSTILEKILG